MPRFKPLLFTTYNWGKDINPQNICTPPYDVYDNKYREILFKKSNYNFAHLDLPLSYEQAQKNILEWQKKEILRKLSQESFILLKTEYEVENKSFTRWGVLGGLKLSPLGKEYVFPHEKTYPKAKEDRLKLMQSTSSQFSPIFGLYADSTLFLTRLAEEISTSPCWLTFKETENLKHSAWLIPEKFNSKIINFFQDKKIFIADGHHRYETALNYQKIQNRPGPWDYVFMYLSNMSSPGVNILPYHRLLSWEENFHLDKIEKASSDFFITNLDIDNTKNDFDFIFLSKNKTLGFKYKKERKDNFHHISTYILDEYILKKVFNISEEKLLTGKYIKYTPFAEEVKTEVLTGHYQAGFLVQKVELTTFQEMCLQNQLMPRKSTYFYPKIPSGLVFYSWI